MPTTRAYALFSPILYKAWNPTYIVVFASTIYRASVILYDPVPVEREQNVAMSESLTMDCAAASLNLCSRTLSRAAATAHTPTSHGQLTLHRHV